MLQAKCYKPRNCLASFRIGTKQYSNGRFVSGCQMVVLATPCIWIPAAVDYSHFLLLARSWHSQQWYHCLFLMTHQVFDNTPNLSSQSLLSLSVAQLEKEFGRLSTEFRLVRRRHQAEQAGGDGLARKFRKFSIQKPKNKKTLWCHNSAEIIRLI